MVQLTDEDARSIELILLQIADEARARMLEAAVNNSHRVTRRAREDGLQALRLAEKLRGEPEGTLDMPPL